MFNENLIKKKTLAHSFCYKDSCGAGLLKIKVSMIVKCTDL